MNIKTTRSLRHERRLSVHQCNKYETVAEHSFYVALIAREIAIDMRLSPNTIGLIVDMALLHDVEEAITGDINYLVRREIPNIKDLEEKARAEIQRSYVYPEDIYGLWSHIIEFADAYEFKMYLEEERRSGNSGLMDIEKETFGRIVNTDIGNSDVHHRWIMKLEDIGCKGLPDFISHEGK